MISAFVCVCVFVVKLTALLAVAATGDYNALVQRQPKIPPTYPKGHCDQYVDVRVCAHIREQG